MSRRTDIDWLRVIATYLLFVFHVGKVFDPAPFFHIRNADQSFILLVVCGFISLWHMPLFFLLAGWSAASSLELRGTRVFLRERLHRLGVPLVAGCVLLAARYQVPGATERARPESRRTPHRRRAPGRHPPPHPRRSANRSAIP